MSAFFSGPLARKQCIHTIFETLALMFNGGDRGPVGFRNIARKQECVLCPGVRTETLHMTGQIGTDTPSTLYKPSSRGDGDHIAVSDGGDCDEAEPDSFTKVPVFKECENQRTKADLGSRAVRFKSCMCYQRVLVGWGTV